MYLVGIQWVVIGFVAYEGIMRWGRLDTIDHLEQDYYIRNGEWDKVITSFNKPLCPSAVCAV